MLWNFLWPCKLLSLPSLTTQQKSEVVSTLGKPWGSDFDWSLNCLSPVANTAFGSFFNTLEKILDVFMFRCPSRLSARGLLALPAGGWLNRGGHQERSAVTLPCSVMIAVSFESSGPTKPSQCRPYSKRFLLGLQYRSWVCSTALKVGWLLLCDQTSRESGFDKTREVSLG